MNAPSTIDVLVDSLIATAGDGSAIFHEHDVPELRTCQREILSGLRRWRQWFVLTRDASGALMLTIGQTWPGRPGHWRAVL
jgi:hypothetical protein